MVVVCSNPQGPIPPGRPPTLVHEPHDFNRLAGKASMAGCCRYSPAVNVATARTARRLAPFLVWGGVLVAWCIVVAPPLWTYVWGDPTTATVVRCETSVSTDSSGGRHENTTCHGTWRLAGERHTGRIFGGEEHASGAEIAVRATGGRAATEDTPRQALLFTGIGVLVGAAAHALGWFQLTRRINKARR